MCVAHTRLQMCRKDLLAKNIKRHKRQLEKDGRLDEAARYDFIPITFILPGDYALFVEVNFRLEHVGHVSTNFSLLARYGYLPSPSRRRCVFRRSLKSRNTRGRCG